MESLLRISIVTPSFNQGKFIERTIRSVLDQAYPNLDYIVVDGGSTDETLEILRRYENRLRWISEPDRGQSDAINKGLQMATGDILAYLNSDDLLQPRSLARINQYFIDHPRALWLTGFSRIIDTLDHPVHSFISHYKNFFLHHYHYASLLTINYISQMSTFWRRSAMEQVGVFNVDQHLAMDYDYWLRLAKLGRPAIILEELSAFRIHPSSKSTNRLIQHFQESAQLAARHAPNPFLKALSYLHHYAAIAAYRVFGLR